MALKRTKYKQIVKEWKDASRAEIIEAIRDNFKIGRAHV